MPKKKGVSSSADAVQPVDQLVDRLVDDFRAKVGTGWSTYGIKVADFPSGRAVLELDRELQVTAVEHLLDLFAQLDEEEAEIDATLKEGQTRGDHPRWSQHSAHGSVLRTILDALLRRKLPFGEAQLTRMLKRPLRNKHYILTYGDCLSGLSLAAVNFAEANELSPPLRKVLGALVKRMSRESLDKTDRNIVDRFAALLHGGPRPEIEPGEAWSDVALADLRGMKAGPARAWNDLLLHCQTGGKRKFTEKWRGEAQVLVNGVGFDSFKDHALRWFPLVDEPRTQPVKRPNAWSPDANDLLKARHVELLRGLVWCCGLREDADLARALMGLAVSAYREIPVKGPRQVSLGNACVSALAMMPGPAAGGQLALLKGKVGCVAGQNEIKKALNASGRKPVRSRPESQSS